MICSYSLLHSVIDFFVVSSIAYSLIPIIDSLIAFPFVFHYFMCCSIDKLIAFFVHCLIDLCTDDFFGFLF